MVKKIIKNSVPIMFSTDGKWYGFSEKIIESISKSNLEERFILPYFNEDFTEILKPARHAVIGKVKYVRDI